MSQELKGEIGLFLSTVFFAIVAILVKVLSGELSSSFIALTRFILSIIFSVLLIKFLKSGFKTYDRKALLLRGLFGAIAIMLYWSSIEMTSPGRATLLNTTYPIFIALFSFLFWKEEVRKRDIVSIMIAFAGVFLVFYDGSSHSLLGDILGLGSGISAAFALHYIKRSRENNNPMIILISACLFGILGTFYSAGEIAKMDVTMWGLILALGLASFAAQMAMTYGFKYVSSTKGSIITFAKIPLTLLFSFLIFAEEMNIRFLLGTALIVVALVIERRG